MGISRDIWTTWFNVDNPWTGDGDFETVSAIEKHYGKVCEPDYKIVHAECRVVGGSDEVFDIYTPKDSFPDVLATYCTTDGLICRNDDQEPTGRHCEDYSVRFRCRYTGDDDDSFFPQFDVRIYIILAVVPILIFLIRILWAYIFRRRRQRRREQRRARRRANRGSNGDDDEDDDDSSSIASGLANPPPSYQELFGEPANFGARSSIFAISRDNVPVCAKCQSKPCSVAMIVKKSQSPSRGSETPEESEPGLHSCVGSDDNTSAMQQRTSLEANSEIPLQQIGGNDSSGSQSEINDSQSSPSEQSTLTSSVSSAGVADNLSDVDLSDPPSAQTDVSVVTQANSSESMHIENEVNSQGGSVPTDSDHLQSVDSTNSHALSPLTLSVNMSLVQSKSSISQPCACTCHRTIPFRHEGVEGYENPAYTSDVDDMDSNVRPQFPGMHVPVPGLPRVWSNLSNSSVVTLSELPSYEDALELMKKKKKEAESLQNSN